MKTLIKKLMLLSLLIGLTAHEASAQIYVRVRPPRPHVTVNVRPAAPSPRHVWVEEDWQPSGPEYAWHGGYWVEPPRPHVRWVPGHWRHHRRGYVWIGGTWR